MPKLGLPPRAPHSPFLHSPLARAPLSHVYSLSPPHTPLSRAQATRPPLSPPPHSSFSRAQVTHLPALNPSKDSALYGGFGRERWSGPRGTGFEQRRADWTSSQCSWTSPRAAAQGLELEGSRASTRARRR
ncbi:hypothetical protein GQ55_3G166400 [Panicum hallii var. hallii]|uniref:Uncharacterized protein n=1 Tax=Panicum hallii var. hallii TaxID=1504633 RepID=A0A2T7EAA1_9POAL|nr:hypothetical protein GQ55_3G166400 [Panicum hallii var. hallii]